LYVARTFRRLDSKDNPAPKRGGTVDAPATRTGDLYNDGHARARLDGVTDTSLNIRARFPGAYGNFIVRLYLHLGQNALAFNRIPDPNNPASSIDEPRLSAVNDRDVVLIHRGLSPSSDEFYLAIFDPNTQQFSFTPRNSANPKLDLTGTGPNSVRRTDTVQVIKVNVTVQPSEGIGAVEVWEGLALDPDHTTNGALDALTYVFGSHVEDATLEPQHGRDKPIVITAEKNLTDGLKILQAILTAEPAVIHSPAAPGDHPSLEDDLVDPTLGDNDRWLEVTLKGGNDGILPAADDYEGSVDPGDNSKTGLKLFEDLDILSIVAAPGSTFNYEQDSDRADTIINLLIAHCETMKYRIAVIDSGNDLTVDAVRLMRARFDTTYAAMYYPWVRILDPVTQVPIVLPPSGFVSGIYARNDIQRAVYKAPANEVVTLSIGFENLINKSQQDVLNPQGINCFRFFEGRGYRLWGGRTMSSDPEWKYVNLRRYFAYLEHSIDRGTQFAVFEPNGPQLWGNIRQTISDFLLNEFFSGALLGDKPEQAYFVRCDRSTMTQNDLDNGRLIVLVGVAVVKPAEFVIFRIGQWTADRK
jgi:hypothetical protein